MKIKFNNNFEEVDISEINNCILEVKKNLETIVPDNNLKVKKDSMGIKYLQEKNNSFRIFFEYCESPLIFELSFAKLYSNRSKLNFSFCKPRNDFPWDVRAIDPFFEREYTFNKNKKEYILSEVAEEINAQFYKQISNLN